MASFKLTLRHSGGTSQIEATPQMTVFDLKNLISQATKISSKQIIIKAGYPPKELQMTNSAQLQEVNIKCSQLLIIEKANLKEMIRRIIPADNSCLFTCISLALKHESAYAMRELIRDVVSADQNTYNSTFLEKSNQDYCKWILQKDSWGGAIELSILSSLFQVEMVAVDIVSLGCRVFGEDQGFQQRIYLLYDGIHYDLLARNFSDTSPLNEDEYIFTPYDIEAFEECLKIAKDLNKLKQFVDVKNFSIQCGTCMQGFIGQKDAVEHCKTTGHTNFRQLE